MQFTNTRIFRTKDEDFIQNLMCIHLCLVMYTLIFRLTARHAERRLQDLWHGVAVAITLYHSKHNGELHWRLLQGPQRMWNSAWMIPIVTIVVAIVHQSTAFFAPAPVVLSTKRRAPTFPSLLASSRDDSDLTKREELKTQLLTLAEEFKSIQSDLTNAVAYETKMEKDADGCQRYYLKLLRRIVRKVMGRKPKNTKSMLY